MQVLSKIFNDLEEQKVLNFDNSKMSNISEKIENLYKQNGAKLCIESGCHCITNNKPEEKSYLSAMYSQVTSLEKYFTNYLTSIQSREDNLYQEALGKVHHISCKLTTIIEYTRGINYNQESLFENSVEKELLKVENQYSRINHYKFGFLTWNLGGKSIDMDFDIENTMISDNDALNSPPDIYFVGFQETRKLNAFALIKGASKSKVSK